MADILDLIDGAIDEYEECWPDAMRWTPEEDERVEVEAASYEHTPGVPLASLIADRDFQAALGAHLRSAMDELRERPPTVSMSFRRLWLDEHFTFPETPAFSPRFDEPPRRVTLTLSTGEEVDLTPSVSRVNTVSGPLINVHSVAVCSGEFCSIHNPSRHPLRTAPLNWRGHVMERVCPHGIGHPDPDDAAWRERTGQPVHGIHGCDGCCHQPSIEESNPA